MRYIEEMDKQIERNLWDPRKKRWSHTTAGRSADRTGAAGWWDGRNNRC